MVDNKSIFYVAGKTEKIQPARSPQQMQSKSDRRMTPNLFGDYFERVQASAVCKINLCCRGIDALRVINEGCIATSRNVAKVCSPITLN